MPTTIYFAIHPIDDFGFWNFKNWTFNLEMPYMFFPITLLATPVIIEMNGSQSFPYYWYVFYSFHNTIDSKLDMIQSKIQVQFESQKCDLLKV